MIDLKQNLSKWTMLPLLTLIYGVGELGHFLIGVVIRSVSQDIGFGDKSCLAVSDNLGNSSSKVSDTFCSKYETPEGCLTAHVDNHTNESSCEWNYNGLGIEYQVLAGPVFMCCFTVFGLMWGFIGDRLNRVYLLSIAIVIYSFGISGTAFSHEYWHIVLFRMVLAAGASASSPLAAGMIGDVYPPHQRALAMAVFNWGIYFGFGGSFAVGNYINDKNIFDQPWRTSFLLTGLPGIVIVILFFLTVNEPRNSPKTEKEDKFSPSAPTYELKEKVEVESNILHEQDNPDDDENIRESVGHTLLGLAKRPEIIILAVAACIRHSAGYCWGYNSALYFQTYYPDFDATMWLTGISIGGGVVGCLIGGFVSDRLVNRMGMSSRALVLAGSQLLSTPFTFGLLYTEPPYCFIYLFLAIITSEMWFAVVYAMLIELVPVHVRSTFMGIALLIINNAGGNLPILVKPWRSVTDYRTAIAIHYPGALLTSSVLFFVCWIFLRKK